MIKRRVYDDEKHVHFVTFSCYKRRNLVQTDRAKRIVIGHLGSRLSKQGGLCLGFVIMPNHVHILRSVTNCGFWEGEAPAEPHAQTRFKLGRSLALPKRRTSVFSRAVHTLIWFPEVRQLSPLMNKWKDQSSRRLKELFRTEFSNYWSNVDDSEPIWQPRYYGFNIWSRQKVEEKLDYMHMNPVRAGLVNHAADWKWSSARWYLEGKPVGLPIRWPPGLETDDECEVRNS